VLSSRLVVNIPQVNNAKGRNTRVVQLNSQALLVQGFTRGGVDRLEAEQLVRRIQLGCFDGDGCAEDAGPAPR
jgi:hypothetical protein